MCNRSRVSRVFRVGRVHGEYVVLRWGRSKVSKVFHVGAGPQLVGCSAVGQVYVE